MAASTFRLTQADTAGREWQGLSFRSHVVKSEGRISVADPIIERVFAGDIDYGKLFAYCFRRFGYPMHGWDDYKQLVTYYLATPHPDLILAVTPSVSGTASLSLRFLVEYETGQAVQDYARRDGTAWRVRMLDWAEEQGLPEWMAEWVAVYNTENAASYPHLEEVTSWRQIPNLPYLMGDAGARYQELSSLANEYRKQLHEEYSKVEVRPAYYYRPVNVCEWNSDDPLKPLARAANEALQDLLSPVPVRDQYINALGLVEDLAVKETDDGEAEVDSADIATSAGYPSGSLGNCAPKAFSELHRLVLTIGNGDAQLGIEKAIAAIEKGQREAQ